MYIEEDIEVLENNLDYMVCRLRGALEYMAYIRDLGDKTLPATIVVSEGIYEYARYWPDHFEEEDEKTGDWRYTDIWGQVTAKGTEVSRELSSYQRNLTNEQILKRIEKEVIFRVEWMMKMTQQLVSLKESAR